MAVYTKERSVRSFEEDLHLHLLNGYVINRPDFFIMGRHVDSRADPEQIVNPEWLFDPMDCDCWHVYLMAGDMARAFEAMPFPLPLISFERKNELHFQLLADIRRLTGATTTPA